VRRSASPRRSSGCDGSDAETPASSPRCSASGVLSKLNDAYPNSYLHRSNPNDVARTEHLTFICTPSQADAGPNNYWKSPEDGRKTMLPLYDGCMAGRTMYVVPYLMGPVGLSVVEKSASRSRILPTSSSTCGS
jgi:phosphoenolpyruvate carboxykinase (GTP)